MASFSYIKTISWPVVPTEQKTQALSMEYMFSYDVDFTKDQKHNL